MSNQAESFRATMQSAGLSSPEYIEPDQFHRFPGVGKRNGNTAGWCKLFNDGRGGVFGDYSSGLSETWQAEHDKPITGEERAAFSKQIQESRKQAEERKCQEQEAAAKEAKLRWEAAQPADENHPYLVKKRLSGAGLRQDGSDLLIDMRDESGQLRR